MKDKRDEMQFLKDNQKFFLSTGRELKMLYAQGQQIQRTVSDALSEDFGANASTLSFRNSWIPKNSRKYCGQYVEIILPEAMRVNSVIVKS